MARPRLTIRIDLANGSRMGPGKVALLEAVQRHRSISAAARDLDMSYRRAWLLLDDLNRAFAEPVIETHPGRSHGTGAALTRFGERLVAMYRSAERAAARSTATALDEIARAANRRYQRETASRRAQRSGARAS
jgi:molybdate transport system regulatory protein